MTVTGGSRVKGGKQEVQQEADGLLHVDLVSGWHPFVELVKNGGEHSLQAGHVELYVWIQVIQSVLPQRFDDVPNVHQVHCNGNRVNASAQGAGKGSGLLTLPWLVSTLHPRSGAAGLPRVEIRLLDLKTVHSATNDLLNAKCISYFLIVVVKSPTKATLGEKMV